MGLLKEDLRAIDEMTIVDMLTKFIFDSESVLNEVEQVVIDLVVETDPSLTNTSRRDVGEFLRAMDVNEMIRLVTQIKVHLDYESDTIIKDKEPYGSSMLQ